MCPHPRQNCKLKKIFLAYQKAIKTHVQPEDWFHVGFDDEWSYDNARFSIARTVLARCIGEYICPVYFHDYVHISRDKTVTVYTLVTKSGFSVNSIFPI